MIKEINIIMADGILYEAQEVKKESILQEWIQMNQIYLSPWPEKFHKNKKFQI